MLCRLQNLCINMLKGWAILVSQISWKTGSCRQWNSTDTGTTVLCKSQKEKLRVISVLLSCWLITVDMYFLMPSGTQNHTIPTMHRKDIFLCQNLLSEWAFELGCNNESAAPSEMNSYNPKIGFCFHYTFQWSHAQVVLVAVDVQAAV